MTVDSKFGYPPKQTDEQALYGTKPTMPSIYGQSLPHVPDLPPRIDRASKPPSATLPTSTPTSSLPSKSSLSVNSGGTLGRSAHERLFDNSTKSIEDQQDDLYTSSNKLLNTLESKKLPSNGNSLERREIIHGHHHSNLQNSLDRQNSAPKNGYDSMSSYDSFNPNPNQQSMNSTMSPIQSRLGPNAPDDLKSIPGVTNRASINNSQDYTSSVHRSSMHDRVDYVTNGNIHTNGNGIPQRPTNLLIESPRKPAHVETKSDYSKYSR
jgi:tight junction protein 1